MSNWIKKMAARKEAQEAASSQLAANPQPLCQLEANLQPLVVLPSITRAVEQTPPAPSSGKRPASLTTGDNRSKHLKTASQVEHLKHDLEHERKMRKQLAAQVSELLKQISTLTQTVTALMEELRQERSTKTTPRAVEPSEPSNQNSADSISEEAIKNLVASIIEPALKNLMVLPAQQKGRQGKVKPATSTTTTPTLGENSSKVAEKVSPETSHAHAASQQQNPSSSKAPATALPETSYACAVSGKQNPTSKGMPKQTSMPNDTEPTTQESEPLRDRTTQPPNTGSQESGFQLSKAERTWASRKATKDQKKKEKEEREKMEAEQKRKKDKKRKCLPSSIKHDPSTLLLLPNDTTPNVLQKLQNMPEVDPRGLGIKRHIPFPSGALLVTCGTTAQAEQLRSATAKVGISEKVRKTKPSEFRIHAIPGGTTTEQLKQDLEKHLGAIEAHISLLPYHNPRFAGQLFAVVQTNLEDLKKVEKPKSGMGLMSHRHRHTYHSLPLMRPLGPLCTQMHPDGGLCHSGATASRWAGTKRECVQRLYPPQQQD